MRLKISFFNKSIFLSDLKRYSWIGLLYFLGLFTNPLLIILFDIPNILKYKDFKISSSVLNYWSYTGLLTFLAGMLTSILIFSYIHSKEASDSIHSLPVKRETLYFSHVFSGCFILLIPVILNTAIILGLVIRFKDFFVFGTEEVFSWGLYITLYCMLFFTVTTFCASITGSIAVQGFLTIVLLNLPGFLYLTGIPNLYGLVFGYYAETNFQLIDKLIPLGRIFGGGSMPKMGFVEKIVYISLVIIFFILGAIFYRVRKSEKAGESIVFKPFEYIFKYGAAFCGMLFVGSYSTPLAQGKLWSILLSYFIGSFVCYLVAEMILNKRFNVFNRKLFQYVYFLIAMIAIIGIVKLDVFGFERYVPKPNEVKAMIFKDDTFLSSYNFSTYKIDNKFFNRDIINNTIRLHEYITKNKRHVLASANQPFSWTSNLYIKYYLKDGKEIERQYVVDRYSLSKYLKPIYENRNYKQHINPLFKVRQTNVKSIVLTKRGSERQFNIKEEDIQKFLTILKEEFSNTKYEELVFTTKEPWGYITINLKNVIYRGYNTFASHLDVPFSKSYSKLEKWLSERGYIKYARVMPDEIAYAAIGKVSSPEKVRNSVPEKLAQKAFKKATDKSLIEKYLRNYENPYIWHSYKSNGKQLYYIIFFDRANHIYDWGLLKSL
ncbi:DUF6449 domain-containing protein [Anaerocellum diazotrophicum]|uniref:DUF6449 domain-containing protein n=1 Tax=Caldicellulosiruptor diazotrophicus TaxID=2806205 RepID=A0ABN6E4U1_9FIRM|nr:DUF6449 domain-containing protein [Caldicellulosiruptor diazotrophicus]BCS80400.1 hypothetical protein CaldiYA01_03600 [Caldicellulosiruptor diazotrophicus]